MKFCFTGFFKIAGKHIKRSDIRTLVVDAGHRFDSSVKYDTQYLVLGNQKAGYDVTTKMRAAEQQGTKVISPDQAFLLLSGTGNLEGESYVEEL